MSRPTAKQIRTLSFMFSAYNDEHQYWHGWWSMVKLLKYTGMSRQPYHTLRSLIRRGFIQERSVQDRHTGEWMGSMLRLTPKAVQLLKS